jgi:ribonuclease HI
MLPRVRIYTDGSCRPNPGPGGWGVVIIDGNEQVATFSGSEEETTNNRMELTAALRGLQQLDKPHEVELFTDSRYVKDGISQWMKNWLARGWTTITGEEVRNRDLWQQLAAEITRHTIAWSWVKGHSTERWNILADELAGGDRQKTLLPLGDEGSIHIFLAITWRQKIGAGAWAGVMRYRHHLRVVGNVRREGSGNSLHIVSAVESLTELKRPLPVHIYTTSGYLQEGANNWLNQWRGRDWQTREGLEVSNRAEWQTLAGLLDRVAVTFHLIDKAEPPCHLAAAKEMAKDLLAAAVKS